MIIDDIFIDAAEIVACFSEHRDYFLWGSGFLPYFLQHKAIATFSVFANSVILWLKRFYLSRTKGSRARRKRLSGGSQE